MPLKKHSLTSPQGQIGLVKDLFRKHVRDFGRVNIRREKKQAITGDSRNTDRRKKPQDMSPGKIWMRKEIQERLKQELHNQLFAEAPYIRDYIINDHPNELITRVAKEKFNGDTAKARAEVLRLLTTFEKRGQKMINAQSKVRIEFQNSLDSGKASEKRRSYYLNTQDAFAHLLADAGLIELFKSHFE